MSALSPIPLVAGLVGSLVLLDAFKPKDGERAADYSSEFSRKALEEALARGEAGRKSPPAKTFSIVEKHYPWIEQRLSQQPNSIVFNPIRLTGKLETVAKKTYIRAPRYPQAAFDKAFEECKANPTWRTMTVENSGHDVMIDQPEWLADVFIKSA